MLLYRYFELLEDSTQYCNKEIMAIMRVCNRIYVILKNANNMYVQEWSA